MIVWIVFIAIIILFLAFDLGFFNKTPKVISTKEAAFWTLIWVSLALLFSFAILLFFKRGWVANPTQLVPGAAMLKYITGYLIELSLSIDNIFVIAVIFYEFRIPQKYQHRVLFWGILGAIFFRALMIFFGVALFRKFEWITFIFGVFLIFTAIKILVSKVYGNVNIKNSFTFRVVRKFVPITSKVENQHFFIRRKHILAATPLFLALIIIEITDVLFALDSIPAILAITTDPFIVFSSNIMAILGLRTMFFFLSNMTKKFYYIKYSIVAILSYVGIKLILANIYDFPEWFSLGFIFFALATGILFSLRKR